MYKKHLLRICLFVFIGSGYIYSQNEEAPTTFYTLNGKLYDKTQSEFIIRGVNNPHVWFPLQSYEALEKIAESGSNTVRVVWQTSGEASELRRIIQKIVDLKMIAMPELHDFTGNDDISALENGAKYWVKDDVRAVLNDFKPYVLLNIANEWMKSNDLENWFKGYKSAISIIRDAGLEHCIVIDGAKWGQSIDPIKKYAKDLLKHDPLHNLLFDIHMYGSWNDKEKITNELKYVYDNKIPLIVGEFGYNAFDGKNNLGCKVDAPHLLDVCEKYKIGHMAWSWTGNNKENEWLDLLEDWKEYTEWGKLVFESKNGVKNTSKRCNVYK